MFLFWGPEQISFYNDAYRPSLGNNGKHPSALGETGFVVFPEIWKDIKPIIDRVHAGEEATLYNDLLLPIYRNGQLEDVYWTFCYSAIFNDEGNIGGVLVVCQETFPAQVQAKRAIVASEARFRSLIKAAPIGIGLFIGRDLIIEEPNQTFIDIVGKGDWIIGKRLVEAMPELVTEGQPFLKILDDVYTSGKMFQTTGTMVKILRNGKLTYNYYDFTYTPLFNDEGRVYAILDIAIDVTPQVMAREALQKSEENLRNIIEHAPVAMAILGGPDAVVRIANERMFELWGKPGKEVLNKPIWAGLPEATGQGLEELLLSVYTTGVSYHGNEVPITLPRDGKIETAFINFTYDAFRDGDGVIDGVMVVGSDVTDQVLARKDTENKKTELEESGRIMQKANDQLTLALKAGELGLFELDLINNTIDASPRFREIFEMKADTPRNDYVDVVHPDDREIRRLAYEASAETGVVDYIARIIVSNNNIKWIRVQGIVTVNAEGKPARVMGILQDITAGKELEFQKDTFIGIASHELKTPVTTIKAYVQIMEQQFRETGDTRFADMMNRVDRQVNRLNFLISDLLDVTKINSGKIQFNMSDFNFGEMLEEVTDDIRRVSNRHSIRTDFGYTGAVHADRERLSQVLTNLVNNAIKYSPNADHVNVTTREHEGIVEVCVEDFGIGISADKQDRVFEQFYRVSGTRQNTFPGLGLGLYISSEILKRLGGKIWVNSTEGKGSTFCFSFPVENRNIVKANH